MEHINKYSKAIMSFICMLIFVIATYQMIPFVSVKVVDVIKYTILIFVLVKLSFLSNGIAGRISRWGVLVFIVLCTLIYLFKMENAGEIAEELRLIWQNYIQEWNFYYEGTEISDAIYMIKVEDTLCFVIVMVSMLLTWISCMTECNIIMSIAPFAVIAIEHLVGVTPDNMSVILLFVGIVFCRVADFTRPYIACAVIIGICVVVNMVGPPSDERIHDYSETMKEIRNDVVEAVTGIDYEAAVFGEEVEAEIGDEDSLMCVSTDGSISNDMPNKVGLPIMKVTLDKKPRNNMYFKGFHGSVFYDRSSHYHEDGYGFSDMTVGDIKMNLMMNELDEETIYEKIVSYIEDNLKDNTEFFQEIGCDVEYYIRQDTSVFVPYFSSGLPELEPESDVIYHQKSDYDASSYEVLKSLNNIKIFDLNPNMEEWIGKVNTGAREEWEDVYKEFSYRNNYGSTMEMAEDDYDKIYKIVKKIDKKINEEEKSWDYSPYPDYWNMNKKEIAKLQRLYNERYIKLAKMVRKWLADNTTYTLTPDIIDDETNPVIYFLLKGKKGYCVHYASAAIVLLRELNVPTRYASGFVVTIDSFEKKGEKYEAEVFDKHAHAWIEIFLEGIGWIPFEMTSGYAETERPVKQEEENAKTTLAPIATPKVQNDDKKEGEHSNIFANIPTITDTFLIALILSGLIMMMTFIVNVYHGRKKFLEALKKRKTIYVIKSLNRRIYKQLRIKGKLIGRNIGDDDYEMVLKKTYTVVPENDWERYMEIVKAVAFSNKVITEEEMEFCYEIYKKCR